MPKPSRLAYHTGSLGPDQKALARGLIWLKGEAEKRGGEGLIVVNGFDNLEGLTEIAGEGVVKALRKGGRVRIGAAMVRCVTERTMRTGDRAAAALILWPSPKLLDRVDALLDVDAVCVVPWAEGEADPWIATWRALNLSDPQTPAPAIEASPLLEIALGTLTKSVNLGTGVGHPMDKDKAIATFTALRSVGETPGADELKAHLLRLRWSPGSANEVVDIAQKIFQGRSVRGTGSGPSPERLLALWKDLRKPPPPSS